MIDKRHRAIVAAEGQPWAMLTSAFEGMLARVCDMDEEREEDGPTLFVDVLDPSEIAASPEAGLRLPRVSGSIAVVPVRGVIDQRPGWWTDTSTDQLQAIVADLMGNQAIGAVVLDIDSPGGTVAGVPETADLFRGMRGGDKPLYAIANSMAASAAYWIGSAVDRLFVTPSGQAGSIGVWTAHVDESAFLERVGFKLSVISAGKYKVEGNPWEPLTEEARAAIQAEVDEYYEMFVDAVAKNRGKRASTIRGGFGEGRLVMAQAALNEGMVDGIATLPELLGAIVTRRGGRQKAALASIAIERARG